MMFNNPTAGGIPPHLAQLLQQGRMGSPMGAAGQPMGQAAMPQVPMPGPSQGAGGAIPQGGGMFGGLAPQQPQQQGGMFGSLDPAQALALANLFKPLPEGGPNVGALPGAMQGPAQRFAGTPGGQAVQGFGQNFAAQNPGAVGGGMGDIGSLLRMMGLG